MSAAGVLGAGLALLGAAGCGPATTSTTTTATTATDWTSFLEASSRCEAQSVKREIRTAGYGIWRTVGYGVTIEGRKQGRCVVRFVATSVDVEFPRYTLESMAERGLSPAQIQKQVADTKDKQQSLVGKRATCAFPARRTRAYLTYWAEGAAPLKRRESCGGPLIDAS